MNLEITNAQLAHFDWAVPHPHLENTVLVDPNIFYPKYLDELGAEKVDQYWMEVAYQCMKMDLQLALGRFGFVIHVRSDEGRKQSWNYSMRPVGKGAALATGGKEARQHFLRLRGKLPE